MAAKGSRFEILTKKFASELFPLMGFQVIKIRKQWAGTQYGFDVHVIFLDDNSIQREICLECKDYSKEVEWKEILDKIIQVHSSIHDPDAFIALSPHSNISNIRDGSLKALEKIIKFPIDLWCPDGNIEEIFATCPEVFKEIYQKEIPSDFDRESEIKKIKRRIEFLINKKTQMNIVKKISINESSADLIEDKSFKIKLDEKLDSIIDKNDPDRISYHKFRCDYKIYLQELEDLDNDLRLKIIKWQDDLRIKAERLTKKFNDLGETPKQFFHDFFDIAEKSMMVLLSNNNFLTEDTEKLLQGVVFELAAECPLNWVKKNG